MHAVESTSKGGVEIDVWYRFTGMLPASELEADVALLDASELAQRNRFVFDADRRDFTAAHGLLRRVLSRHRPIPPAAWRFETSPHGKPSIAPDQIGSPPLAFSLSHTKGLVACAAIEATEIGVDVESIDRAAHDAQAIAARYFSPLEIRELQTQPEARRRARFIEIWTLKESYIKAIGLGLSRSLDSFAFQFPDDRTVRFHGSAPDNGSPWQFALFSLGDRCNYRLAVAIRANDRADHRTIRLRDAGRTPGAPATLLHASMRDGRATPQ